MTLNTQGHVSQHLAYPLPTFFSSLRVRPRERAPNSQDPPLHLFSSFSGHVNEHPTFPLSPFLFIFLSFFYFLSGHVNEHLVGGMVASYYVGPTPSSPNPAGFTPTFTLARPSLPFLSCYFLSLSALAHAVSLSSRFIQNMLNRRNWGLAGTSCQAITTGQHETSDLLGSVIDS